MIRGAVRREPRRAPHTAAPSRSHAVHCVTVAPRLYTRAALAALLAAALASAGSTAAEPAPPSPAEPAPAATVPAAPTLVHGGRHWRIKTVNGPVHVWTPPGYQPATAGVVLYVHGYYTRLDAAWRKHRLPAQFAASGRNALFIVPEAPARGRDEVSWRSLGDLIREVRRHTGLAQPWGSIVAVGHSGAYRTLLHWLDDRRLAHVILLDGLYGNEDAFLAWLDAAKRPPNRLTLIGLDTLRWSELAAPEHPDRYQLDWLPDRLSDIPADARGARFLHICSQRGHMDIVTEGQVLPLLLQLSPLPAAASPRPLPRSPAASPPVTPPTPPPTR